MQLPQLLKGFRDFLPADKRKRDYVASVIKTVFERHGFEPLETPTLEYASLLLGKYGQEADKLVYTFDDKGDRKVGLRYDQTVPTARVLAQYQHELPKYFRRYQIQNVFRADKPQKGRFREFTQSDCDIFGSTSTLADAEILSVYYDVYRTLGMSSIRLEINDRQTLLATLSAYTNDQVSVFSLIQSIDKLDKQTPTEIQAELIAKGLPAASAEQALIAIENAAMSDNLKQIVDNALLLGVPQTALVFNPKLARGLDYYTGLIFEGKVPEYGVGSLGGGGRYDQLVHDLSGVDMPAVGFGIGFDRTVEAADELGLIPSDHAGTQVLVTIFDESAKAAALQTATQLRQADISTEVFPALEKLAKQFKMANQKKIPWVIIIGESEIASQQVTLKNMTSGEQNLMTLTAAIAKIQESLT